MSSINTTELIVDLLRRGHAVKFRVRGDSMHPTIRDNESLHVEPVTDVRIGDVVLVLADRGLTAHRVIAMDAETITTRGDNAPYADAPVTRDRILGKVVWSAAARAAALLRRGIAAARRRLR